LRRKKGCTTSSGDTIGFPAASCAMPSKKRMSWSAASGSWLDPSFDEPLRITIRLRASPVVRSVRSRLEIRPRKSVVATTTSPITATVRPVRRRRANRLRTLYEIGSATD
jgi:hypothetical protein